MLCDRPGRDGTAWPDRRHDRLPRVAGVRTVLACLLWLAYGPTVSVVVLLAFALLWFVVPAVLRSRQGIHHAGQR